MRTSLNRINGTSLDQTRQAGAWAEKGLPASGNVTSLGLVPRAVAAPLFGKPDASNETDGRKAVR